ncbi:vegetative cell wall protein gp1-like isoform X3 [Aricia agestis]|nr:vegetative cell wall protein gp1-like isoform X3 [Aricia agestis]
MHAVNEIISILEKFNITKELLETTRLGKYVNELRRKTTDPTLARRAKVLVKRWRDLVMPAVASPAHAPGSNRSSAERTHRRFGGTPLTSPALSMHAVSPAVPSPRLPTRPAWGGYESDSQDVILVDDDPPPPAPAPPIPPLAPLAPLATHKPTTPPVKRPPSPEPVLQDEKKAKRDKKPKRRRGRPPADASAEPPGEGQWEARNGSAPERRRNGWRREDAYTALVQRLPPAGAKKVKTTKELLEQIQSRAAPPSRAASPVDPGSPDVMLVEPDVVPIKSPLRNGTDGAVKAEPEVKEEEPVEVWEPLEEEREWAECTCGDDEDATCPAAARDPVRPRHVRALHHALLPGVNGTRAPALPQRFAVRAAADPDRPGLFASVVPLYKYSDYADDYCVKNMARVPVCAHLPWTEFAPAPPSPPPPPDPPELRPYPWPDEEPPAPAPLDPDDVPTRSPSPELEPEPEPVKRPVLKVEYPATVEAEAVGVPILEPSERLKAPLLSPEEAAQYGAEPARAAPATRSFACESPEHRTVERTKREEGVEVDGRALCGLCAAALRAATWRYEQAAPAPVLGAAALADDAALNGALEAAYAGERDALGRPARAERFAEWHEPARLGDLVALPYVVLD